MRSLTETREWQGTPVGGVQTQTLQPVKTSYLPDLPEDVICIILKNFSNRELSLVSSLNKDWGNVTRVLFQRQALNQLKKVEEVLKNKIGSFEFIKADAFIRSANNLSDIKMRAETIKSAVHANMEKIGESDRNALKTLAAENYFFRYFEDLINQYEAQKEHGEISHEVKHLLIKENGEARIWDEVVAVKASLNERLAAFCQKLIQQNLIAWNDIFASSINRMQYCVGYGSPNPKFAAICKALAEKNYITKAVEIARTQPLYCESTSFHKILYVLIEKGDAKQIDFVINARPISEKEKNECRQSVSATLCKKKLYSAGLKIVNTITDASARKKVQGPAIRAIHSEGMVCLQKSLLEMLSEEIATGDIANIKRIIEDYPLNENGRDKIYHLVVKELCLKDHTQAAFGIVNLISDPNLRRESQGFVIQQLIRTGQKILETTQSSAAIG